MVPHLLLPQLRCYFFQGPVPVQQSGIEYPFNVLLWHPVWLSITTAYKQRLGFWSASTTFEGNEENNVVNESGEELSFMRKKRP